VVTNSWAANMPSGNSLVGLKEKLKRMKIEIKHWNKEVFSSTKRIKQQLLAEIEELDKCDDEENLLDAIRVKRVDLLSQLRGMEERQIAMIKQKARKAK